MRSLLLLYLVVVITLTYSISGSRAQESLKPLGAAEGKAFFYTKVPPRTWNEADKFCKSQGMRLPSFETRGQLSVVADSQIPDFHYSCYWTSARDSMDIGSGHFLWNDTGSAVDLFGLEYEFFFMDQTCILFCNSGGSRFSVSPCSLGFARSTICEKQE